MLKSLKIENFRCFKSFELQQLGQLNLLVGTNNSGKTSILEALYLLTAQTSLEPLREIMMGRSEYVVSESTRFERDLNIRHLFYGHEIELGSRISIVGSQLSGEDKITLSVEYDDAEQPDLSEELRNFALKIESSGQESKNGHAKSIKITLSSKEGLISDYAPRRLLSRRHPSEFHGINSKAQYVSASAVSGEKVSELFDQVVLTPEEELVVEALQIIEPDIGRIASVQSESRARMGSRNSFVVRLSESSQRVPIGSMGDGIWRMLGLTLAIVNARNGFLFVDEIDTGLHFSTMSKMWQLIWQTAKRLNVQVFATTHNSDCWTSLAALASQHSSANEGITIHRIEKGKQQSVLFTERQVAIAAEQGIEVR
jgi:AAA15 family ATPase/GTPase